MNPYLYAGSNPILHTDPTGLSHCEPGTTNCHRTGAVAHDSSTSNVVGFNLSLPYELLQNTCKLPPGLGDYFRGVVQQVLWDLTWPMHTQVPQRIDTNALIVYVTINGLAPGTLPDI